jgi:hypothetical protein
MTKQFEMRRKVFLLLRSKKIYERIVEVNGEKCGNTVGIKS